MARVNAEHARKGEELERFFCPLYFLVRDHEILYQLFSNLIMASDTDMREVNRLVEWVQNTDLLLNLHDLQVKLDTVGVLEGDPNDENLLAAMTLRDCTV